MRFLKSKISADILAQGPEGWSFELARGVAVIGQLKGEER